MKWENKTTRYAFYQVDLVPGPIIEGQQISAVIIKWGKIGSEGQMKTAFAGPHAEAVEKFKKICKKRRKNNYTKVPEGTI